MRDAWRSTGFMLAAIGLLAIITLGGAAIFVGPPAVVADGLCYNASAARLLNTGVYSYLSLELDAVEFPNAFVTPGYPLLLALGYLFLPRTGDTYAVIANAIPWIVTLHFLCAIGAVVLIAATGRLIAGPRTGWSAGILGALYLPFGAESMSGWAENVSVFLVALLLYLAVRLLKAAPERAIWASIVLGLCAGAATMVRPVFALWVFAPLAIYVWSHRDRLRHAGTVAAAGCVALVLVMSPWVVRNAALMGRFIPLTEHAGTVWIDSVGGVSMSPAEESVFYAAAMRGKDGYKAVAFDRIGMMWADDPLGLVSVTLKGTWTMITKPWSSQQDPRSPLPDATPMAAGPGYRMLSVRAYSAWKTVIQIIHVLMLVLALVGAIMRRKRLEVWALASLPLYLALICGVMGARTRYFYPAMPGVILLAAVGVSYILHRVYSRVAGRESGGTGRSAAGESV